MSQAEKAAYYLQGMSRHDSWAVTRAKKALKTRRRVTSATVEQCLQLDMEGGLLRYTRLIPKLCAVPGEVTLAIAGDDHEAQVRLASNCDLVMVTGGKVAMLDQRLNRRLVRMELELLER